MFNNRNEALEAIHQICIQALQPQKLPPKILKPTGRPKGTGKRKQTDGLSPERLQAIHSAVMSLIPLYTHDWTATGRPCATRIQSLTGLTDVSHWEIQLACPGYSRAKAEVRFQDRKFLGQDHGNWYFEDTRDGKFLTKNLHTTDIDEARRLREVYLETGKWDFRFNNARLRGVN